MSAPYERATLLINGVDYTDWLVPESLSVQAVVQQGVQNGMAFTLRNPPNTFSVEGGKSVDFYLAGQTNPLFRGTQSKTDPKRYGPQSWSYRCQAVGWEQLFYYKQLFTAFRGLSFEGAVNQILNDPEQGFPSGLSRVVSDPDGLLQADMPFYAVNGAFPGDILNLIASLTNASWRVIHTTSTLVLEFFDSFNTYNGFTLTQNNRSFKWDTFEPTIDLDGIINTQTVRGAQAAVQTPETAYFRGDGLSSKFDLPTKPFNNTASVVVFDSFNTSTINTSLWFESDIVGNYVYADGQGFVQYSQSANSWVGLISTGLVGRAAGPMTTVDINWVQHGLAMIGFTKYNAVGADAIQFLEAGVYIDGTGKVFGVANGTSLGDSGVTLATGTQYRFRITCKANGGCRISYQEGSSLYTRNWTELFDSESGSNTALGTAVMSYSAGLSLAMVKTVYPYLNVKLEVDRGAGFQQEEVGVYPIDEDVDAVIIEESTLAFFGSDPGPSTIPPAPTWQNDPDYKNIRVEYNRGVNIFATYRNQESISAIQALFGGNDTGIREGPVIIDNTITSYSAALAKGRVEVLNRSSVISQIDAVTSSNILNDANIPLPSAGEVSRFSVTLPTVNYAISGDIPIRKLKITGKKGLNDFSVEVEAGYLQRGLKTVLAELTRSGQLVSISEDQVIYLGKSVTETISLTETVTSFGSGNTRRWGDSRLDRVFDGMAPGSVTTIAPSSIAGVAFFDGPTGITPEPTNGGRVAAWADSLGSGKTFSTGTAARQPLPQTVDGRQAIYFDGSRHLFGDIALRDMLNGANGYSVIAVCKADNFSAERCFWSMSTNGSASIVRAGLNITASGVKSQGRMTDGDVATAFTQVAGYLDNVSAWQCYGLTVNYTTGMAYVYRGGYCVGIAALPSTGTITNGRAQNTVIGATLAGSQWLLGSLDSLIVSNTPLSHAQHYGLTGHLDANNRPGILCRRVVTVAGDSISLNSDLSSTSRLFYQIAQSLGPNASDYVESKGINGATLATMNTNRSVFTTSLPFQPEQEVIYAFHAGTNDITIDGVSTETAISRYKTLIDNCKADVPKAKFVGSTCIARTSIAITAPLLDFNAAMVRSRELIGLHAISPTGSDGVFDDGNDPNNATYYNSSDKIHPTAAGVLIMAPYIADAIDSLEDMIITTHPALFVTGDDVQVRTTGVLPGGLSSGTVYYINRQSGMTFYLYDTLANAQSGGATGRVNITSSGSGEHTLFVNGWRWGNHKWNSFLSGYTFSAEGTLQAKANTFKRLHFQAEGVMNVRAKVNGV